MRYNDPTRSYQSTKQPSIAVTIVTSSVMWNHTADVILEIHVYIGTEMPSTYDWGWIPELLTFWKFHMPGSYDISFHFHISASTTCEVAIMHLWHMDIKVFRNVIWYLSIFCACCLFSVHVVLRFSKHSILIHLVQCHMLYIICAILFLLFFIVYIKSCSKIYVIDQAICINAVSLVLELTCDNFWWM